jgi:hypothetical protein
MGGLAEWRVRLRGPLERRTFTVLYLMIPLFAVQSSMTQDFKNALTYHVAHNKQRPINRGFQLCPWTGNVKLGSPRV